jgi:hypothetical protein
MPPTNHHGKQRNTAKKATATEKKSRAAMPEHPKDIIIS